MVASAVFLIRQNTNRTRQIAACNKRTFTHYEESAAHWTEYNGAAIQ